MSSDHCKKQWKMKRRSIYNCKNNGFWRLSFKKPVFCNVKLTYFSENLVFYNKKCTHFSQDMARRKNEFFDARKLWQGQQKRKTHYTECCKGCQKPFLGPRWVARDNTILKHRTDAYRIGSSTKTLRGSKKRISFFYPGGVHPRLDQQS